MWQVFLLSLPPLVVAVLMSLGNNARIKRTIGVPITFISVSATVVYAIIMHYETGRQTRQWAIAVIIASGVVLFFNILILVLAFVRGPKDEGFASYKQRVYLEYTKGLAAKLWAGRADARSLQETSKSLDTDGRFAVSKHPTQIEITQVWQFGLTVAPHLIEPSRNLENK